MKTLLNLIILTSLMFFLFRGCAIAGEGTFSEIKPIELSDTSFCEIKLQDGTILKGAAISKAIDEIIIYEINIGEKKINTADIRTIEKMTAGLFYEIKTIDNSILLGQLKKCSKSNLIIEHFKLGEIPISLNRIMSFKKIKPDYQKNWESNPNATRYLFAPSAFPLKKGTGYYQNAYLLSNSVSYGLTDNITIGGGVLLPIAFYIAPKIGFKVSNNLWFGAGVLAAGTYLEEGISAGIGYGLITYGSLENNITLGCGYGWISTKGNTETTERPVFTLNGMVRVSKRLSLVSENWFFRYTNVTYENFPIDSMGNQIGPGDEIIKKVYAAGLSGGLRLVNDRTTFDFALIAPVGINGTNFIIPYIDFVYRF